MAIAEGTVSSNLFLLMTSKSTINESKSPEKKIGKQIKVVVQTMAFTNP
jgi:hypothetical protein